MPWAGGSWAWIRSGSAARDPSDDGSDPPERAAAARSCLGAGFAGPPIGIPKNVRCVPGLPAACASAGRSAAACGFGSAVDAAAARGAGSVRAAVVERPAFTLPVRPAIAPGGMPARLRSWTDL